MSESITRFTPIPPALPPLQALPIVARPVPRFRKRQPLRSPPRTRHARLRRIRPLTAKPSHASRTPIGKLAGTWADRLKRIGCGPNARFAKASWRAPSHSFNPICTSGGRPGAVPVRELRQPVNRSAEAKSSPVADGCARPARGRCALT